MELPVRWGFIGCGDVTEKKSCPAAFTRSGVSSVVAVSRRDSHLAADYAARHGVPTSYSGADCAQSIVADANVGAVYVATPPGSHLSLARLAAASRKPCLVEKPLARSAAEGRALVDAFRETETPLFVAYYRRAYPRYLRLRQLLAEGAVGAVTAVSYRMRSTAARGQAGAWRLDAAIGGGGLFMDVGSHALDLLDYIFGPLQSVQGSARGPGAPAVEMAVDATFSFSGGVADGAAGEASWDFDADEAACDELLITGSAGSLRLPAAMNGRETIHVDSAGVVTMHIDEPPSPTHGPLVDSVLFALMAGDASLCASTGESALRTAVVMDAVLDEYWGGRTDAFWAREAAPAA